MSRILTASLLVAAHIATIPAPAAAQPQDPVVQLLEALTNAPGPSGFEGPVRDIVTGGLNELGAEISHDGLGSLIGRFDGPPGSPRVMVTAHMDEVGLLVQYIRPDGFIKFKTLGGWLDQALIDQRWVINTRDGLVHGVSGIRTIHVTPGSERNQVWGRDTISIDVGATSKADAERMGIRPGDPIAPWSPFSVLANDRYAAKAWDDRVGLGVMLEAMKRIQQRGVQLPRTIYLVATVQRGADAARCADHRRAVEFPARRSLTAAVRSGTFEAHASHYTNPSRSTRCRGPADGQLHRPRHRPGRHRPARPRRCQAAPGGD